MRDSDGLEGFEEQVSALERTLGGAGSMAAAFALGLAGVRAKSTRSTVSGEAPRKSCSLINSRGITKAPIKNRRQPTVGGREVCLKIGGQIRDHVIDRDVRSRPRRKDVVLGGNVDICVRKRCPRARSHVFGLRDVRGRQPPGQICGGRACSRSCTSSRAKTPCGRQSSRRNSTSPNVRWPISRWLSKPQSGVMPSRNCSRSRGLQQ